MERPTPWGAILGAAAVAGLASALAFLYLDFREERERERRFPPALLEKYSVGKQLGKCVRAHRAASRGRRRRAAHLNASRAARAGGSPPACFLGACA